MCKTCDFITSVFALAEKDPHPNYFPVLSMLNQMQKQKRVELIAGDCTFEEVQEYLYQETHFTVCHYYKCLTCEKYFYIGACIRGTPIFKILKNFKKEDVERLLWGRVGTCFTN